jgi:hypothetical protein
MNTSAKATATPRVRGRQAAAILALLACIHSESQNLWAQEEESPQDSASSQDAGQARGNTLVPLPVIFYQPETGLGFGATAIYFFRGSGSRVPPSQIAPVAIYTLEKQIITSVRAELYPSAGRYRVLGELSFIKFPTKFWGIGNETPDSLEEDYTPLTFSVAAELQKQVLPGWYVGAIGQLAYRELRDVEAGGLLSSGLVPGAQDGYIVGLGLLVSRDTRSSTVYPRSGSFHQFRALLYNGFFGSDYEFASLSLDLRKYLSLVTTHVLALRALGAVSPGTPPFDLMPQLGGESLLRGYFAGRYRDNDLLAFQVEYRMPVWWRFGAVAFAAVGQVASDLNGFQLAEFHPAVGAGLRFQLSPQEELDIRADFGWGFDVDSGGFYLSLGEAF